MEAKNLRVWSGTEEFMLGELNNVTLQGGQLTLDSVSGRYVLYGCFTSPVVSFPAFEALLLSWNASTPEGTVVEAQARVMLGGEWSAWFSFGRWSPFLITRANAKSPGRGQARVEENILFLKQASTECQVRIYLYTDDEKKTPRVQLLSVCVRPEQADLVGKAGRPVQRRLRVPAYSQFLRDPSFGHDMSLPVSLAGLLNRWGEDVLPEELAHAMFDWGDRSCHDIPFACAAVGSWGEQCFAVWTDLAHLREEVRTGSAVAVRLTWPGGGGPPALADANETGGHFVVVTGFVTVDGRPYVLVNEPLCPRDDCAPQRWSLEYFLDAWDGLAIVVYKPARKTGWDRPPRIAVHVAEDPERRGVYRLAGPEGPIELPADFCGSPGVPRGTVCFASNTGAVHATTAHKAFSFVQPLAGGVPLPKLGVQPLRLGVYVIAPSGSMLVGEAYV